MLEAARETVRRFLARATRHEAEVVTNLALAEGILWRCGSCSEVNESGSDRCGRCMTWRPGE